MIYIPRVWGRAGGEANDLKALLCMLELNKYSADQELGFSVVEKKVFKEKGKAKTEAVGLD